MSRCAGEHESAEAILPWLHVAAGGVSGGVAGELLHGEHIALAVVVPILQRSVAELVGRGAFHASYRVNAGGHGPLFGGAQLRSLFGLWRNQVDFVVGNGQAD
ncbi:MAG TPA: hypothetical protein VGM94_02695, partial [Galbitalea sp.]